MARWVDVTDLIRFARDVRPATGVQRVVAEVAPLLPAAQPIAFDLHRAAWVPVTGEALMTLIEEGLRTTSRIPRQDVASAAETWWTGRSALEPVTLRAGDTLVLLGSSWIDHGVFLAVQRAHAHGVRILPLLFDLTPVHEAGHSPEVTQGFRRYLAFVSRACPTFLAISAATARDAAEYCRAQGWTVPDGVVTALPPGLLPARLGSDVAVVDSPRSDDSQDAQGPWPRPYLLFVGTIEARKGHLRMLRVWQLLKDRVPGAPDLVCVGRWGWGSQPFRTAWEEAGGAASGVHVLDHGATDAELAAFYTGCLATIYPSNLEGWGLPVTESLAFGKLPITSDRSSMPEAGLGLAVLVDPDDIEAIVDAVTREVLDVTARRDHEARIRASEAYRAPRTWRQVAQVVSDVIGQAESMPVAPDAQPPTIDIDREYVLGIPASVSDERIVRIEAIAADRGTPLLGHSHLDDVVVTDALVTGDVLQPTAWGYPIPVGGSLDIVFRRPKDTALVLLVATAPIVGSGTVDVSVDDAGAHRTPLAYGEVISVPITAGHSAAIVRVRINVVAQDKHDGLPITMQSLLVLDADDPQARIAILERVARARSVQVTELSAEVVGLRAQLDGVLTSRSWRVTAPLRRVTGEGA